MEGKDDNKLDITSDELLQSIKEKTRLSEGEVRFKVSMRICELRRERPDLFERALEENASAEDEFRKRLREVVLDYFTDLHSKN